MGRFVELRRTVWSVCALSLVACAAGDGKPRESRVTDEGTTPAEPPHREAENAGPQDREGQTFTLIGEVRHRGVATCPGADYGRRVWFAKTQLVGGTPIAAAGESFDALEDATRQAVIVTGTKGTQEPVPYGDAPADAGECPLMQMRSDWTETPDGIELDADGHTLVAPALAVAATADAVQRFSGATAHARDDGTLEVAFALPAGMARPAAMSLTVHYEGCYGKPGHHADRREPTRVDGPDGVSTWTETFPPLWTDKDASGKFDRHHAPHRVHWRGDAEGLAVDLVLPVEGYAAACDAVKGERRKQTP